MSLCLDDIGGRFGTVAPIEPPRGPLLAAGWVQPPPPDPPVPTRLLWGGGGCPGILRLCAADSITVAAPGANEATNAPGETGGRSAAPYFQSVERTRQRRKRAPNGDGTVYKAIRSGRTVFVADFRFLDDEGILQRRTAQRRTEAAALDELRKLRLERTASGTVKKHRDLRGPTFKEYATAWLERRKPEVGADTFRQYSGNVRNHLIRFFGERLLRRITNDIVSQFIGQDDIGAPTRKQCLGVLKQIYDDAVDDGIVEKVPFRTDGRRRVKVRVERPEMTVLDEEQQRSFNRACTGHRLEALFVLALASGMRQSEILGLKWQQVKGDHIFVEQRLHARTKNDGQTKTKASTRRIDLPNFVIEILDAHRERMKAEYAARERFRSSGSASKRKDRKTVKGPAAGSLCRPSDYVFVNEVGKPLSGTNLTNRTLKALLRAGNLPNITFHELRHSHATLLLTMGINPKVVQERLGHESVKTTLDKYGHVLPTTQRQAVELLQEMLKPVSV